MILVQITARLALALTLVLLGACGGKAPPNVLLVTVDTLRQDHLSAYGYERPTSPNLERLVAEGVRADGLAPTSWTKPSTATLLTGLHPVRHQAISRNDAIPPAVVTLAELVTQEGYRTLALSGNSWVSTGWGFDQGFERFLSMRVLGYGDEPSAEEMRRVILPEIEEMAAEGDPFFAYLHLIDPHSPYGPPIAWDGGVLEPELQAVSGTRVENLTPFHKVQRDPVLMQQIVDLYDGEIRFADQQIGFLLEELESRGLLDNTVVIVTADHGEEFEDHGLLAHGQTLYEEMVRVPMVLWAPGRFDAGTLLGDFPLQDVAPTVAELLGLQWPEGYQVDGKSRLGELSAGSAKEAEGDSEGPEAGGEPGHLVHLDFDDGHRLGWLQGDRKLIVGREPFAKELYDLGEDPLEQVSLVGERVPADFGKLGSEMASAHNDMSRRSFERTTTVVDDELRNSIRALGYLTFENEAPVREIPRRVASPNRNPLGSIGWEPTRLVPSCADFGEPEGDRQLLGGWHGKNRGEGRWSGPRATFLLGGPETPGKGSCELILRGINHRPDSPTITAWVGDTEVLSTSVESRRYFEARGVIEPCPFGVVEVGFEMSSSYRPAEYGSADIRELGIFLRQACLDPQF